MDLHDPSEPFKAYWDDLTGQAEKEKVLGGGYDRPLYELLAACRSTILRRFYPFTSVARLCFARSAWPFEDVQPVQIEFHPRRRYIVCRGGPYPADANPPIALKTDDPALAAAEAVRLLGQIP